MKNYLNFENEIKDLEIELEKLKDPYDQGGLSEVNTKKITKTQEDLDEKLQAPPLLLLLLPTLGRLFQF